MDPSCCTCIKHKPQVLGIPEISRVSGETLRETLHILLFPPSKATLRSVGYFVSSTTTRDKPNLIRLSKQSEDWCRHQSATKIIRPPMFCRGVHTRLDRSKGGGYVVDQRWRKNVYDH
jgi:hypothetical protein